MPIVSEVTQEINLANFRDRAVLILVLAKLYVLLIKMASSVAPRAGSYPLYHIIKRTDNSFVQIMSSSVKKRIPCECEIINGKGCVDGIWTFTGHI